MRDTAASHRWPGQASARLLRASLFGVGPRDPVVLVAATAVLALVIGLAAWLPARRAAQVDPVIAQRAESRGRGRGPR